MKSGRRPTLRALNPEIPPLLQEAVDRAFALSVEDLVASVEAFAASIAAFGTKSGAALLEQIQGVAQRASSKPPVPTATLAPMHTAPGVQQTSLGGTAEVTPPPPVPRTPVPPRASRSKLFAGIGAVAAVAAVGTVGVRSHWFGGHASAAVTVTVASLCVNVRPRATGGRTSSMRTNSGAGERCRRSSSLRHRRRVSPDMPRSALYAATLCPLARQRATSDRLSAPFR